MFSVITKNLNSEILTKNLVTFKRWDGVKDKKLWYYGCSLKNPSLMWGFTKNQYIRGICLKSGPWTVFRFKRGLAKKRGGGALEGGLIPQCTLWWQKYVLHLPCNTLWNILFKDLFTKFCKSIFYVSAVNCYCTYIF